MKWYYFSRFMIAVNAFCLAACLSTAMSPGGLTVRARAVPADATWVAIFCVLFCLANLVLAVRSDKMER